VPRVLIATCAALPEGDDDHHLLHAALSARGIDVALGVWSDPHVEWDDADLVVIRSPWDYTEALDDFLIWVSSLARVCNPAHVIRWNSDKQYLDDFAQRAVATIPTSYARHPDELLIPDAASFVVKPTVGAGSRGAARFAHDDEVAAQEHVASLVAAGKTAMVQPYLDDVDRNGETALIFLDGVFSHAIEKQAMLASDALDPSGLFRAEKIRPRHPSRVEHDVALKAMHEAEKILSLEQPLLYARVDLIGSSDGPRLIEFEATEPSLFLGYHAEAATRLGDAITRRID